MGRGRAKAKQTKVARQLKYSSGGTDLSRLADELGATQSNQQPPNGEPFEDDEDDDPYARYAELYNDDEEDEGDSSDQRRRA
ncbi:DUF3073 domain-containing protein [Streptomyces angustmyceticus]|jgi:hypothetical protein|uniref:DUF3073 domain-containing protein n=2 Tax=Streptomyces TaxID=1883 RepID=A0A0P4R3V5_9ACTN|nr:MULTISPECIES: DUF3073 domain-containing protein [Streptomyces]UAL68390.1 DUF3073 domain-containing protein [Streptomyces angustmyceticus]USA02472.1 DUF3073 domain-containing protein [Streptomyces lydicamycinicus]GAO07501.1 hypothetical protein TPA0598_02_07410 [Streptomyces lydicamycinicus]GES31867.1 hypothetical protein San01_43540 [Streptomyces angustmyceticus]